MWSCCDKFLTRTPLVLYIMCVLQRLKIQVCLVAKMSAVFLQLHLIQTDLFIFKCEVIYMQIQAQHPPWWQGPSF